MILCDEVVHTPTVKLTVIGLTSTVAWPYDEEVPLCLEKLVVLLILTDGHGTGTAQVICYL